VSSALFIAAWRNLSRNPRRTALTVAVIAIGLAAMIFLWSFSRGLQGNMLRNFQDAIVGSLQVHRGDFFRHPELSKHIERPEEVAGAVETAGEQRWTWRLETFALAAGPETSAGTLLIGVDPGREPRVTRLAEKVTEGRFFTAGDDRACILGASMARNLKVGLGDPVVLMSHDRFGVLAAERFTLVGIITSGELGIDQGLVLAPLPAVQEMLEMHGRVTSVPVRVPTRRLEQTVATLREALADRGYEVLRWSDMFPVTREWVSLSDGFHYVFLGIVLFIVLAGVLNTVLASMLERTRELGVLMAIGMRQRQVGALVSLESLMLGVLGTAAGTALGVALVLVAGRVGIDLSAWLGSTTRFYVDPVIRAELGVDHLLLCVATVFNAALFAGIYPAWRASRLEPAEAMRRV
jgi:ABC-type lipoprotein release transport system permease subunit